MVRVICDSCGKLYDVEGEMVCPRCSRKKGDANYNTPRQCGSYWLLGLVLVVAMVVMGAAIRLCGA